MDFAIENDPQAIVSVTVSLAPGESRLLLAPFGLETPDHNPIGLMVTGGSVDSAREANTGQEAALVRPDPGAKAVTLTYGFQSRKMAYPAEVFRAHDSRYSRVASELLEASRPADPAEGVRAVSRIVAEVRERFVYGHPDVRFNDGLDEVPYLACGVTEGSCVDINTYLIACLRAAGIEAGYITGYFFPEEKGGCCVDMHCWVVSRFAGVCQEWDIAHHLKMGRDPVEPGLNPKPGSRVAMFHSMGLSFPEIGIRDAKLLGEPMWVSDDGRLLPVGAEHLSISMEEGFAEAAFSRA